MPRYFLFGLVRVPMYEYYWGHTKAQIELMTIDVPLTLFKKSDRSGPKPGEKGYKPDAKKLDDAVRKWKKMKAEREKKGFSIKKFLGALESPTDTTGEVKNPPTDSL